MKMNKLKYNVLGLLCAALGMMSLASCTDEPSSENFYTFTGEMASDYLKNRSQYSEFKEIVERAGLMDLLATYGHYTCFVPSNDAVNQYLRERGKSSVNDLTDQDCDTIARTHLVNNMYTTFEMSQDRLPTANMLGRFIATSAGLDENENAVIILEGLSKIYFELQDDSVENGVMQPIDRVIEKSNNYISDLLRDNPKISTFYNALLATKVVDQVMKVEDETYDRTKYPKYYYRSHIWSEVAWVPDTKKYGFTAFVEPDDVLESKYGIAKGDIKGLYDLACTLYDPVYPDDVNKPGHSFENLTDSINPLHRFMQYHFLTRYTAGTSDLTPLDVQAGKLQGVAFGFDEKLINPSDWFQTLLPHTMIKVDKVTVPEYIGPSIKGERYVNRRYDDTYKIPGAHIDATIESDVIHDGLNGHYYYVDDIVAGIALVMKRAPQRKTGTDGLPIPPYAIYNIGGGKPESLLDFVQILQEELLRTGLLPKDYDFEAHKQLVPMQAGDVPVTYADTSALERDFGFVPKKTLREGLASFAEWYQKFYQATSNNCP